MEWLILIGGVAIVVILIAWRWRPWLEEHGWIFPKGQSGNAGAALLRVQALVEPSKEHVIEWQDAEEARKFNLGSGAPGRPGGEPHQTGGDGWLALRGDHDDPAEAPKRDHPDR